MKPVKVTEIWYWPKTDQLLHVLKLEKGWLMFFKEDRYYFYAVSKKTAKRAGIIFMGDA